MPLKPVAYGMIFKNGALYFKPVVGPVTILLFKRLNDLHNNFKNGTVRCDQTFVFVDECHKQLSGVILLLFKKGDIVRVFNINPSACIHFFFL